MRNISFAGMRSVGLVAVVLVALLAINSCGTGTAAPAVTPPSVTIAASPMQIAGGASTTLTVTASNASSVVITDNTDSNTYPVAAAGGTVTVKPGATTTYTVTATGSGGTKTATVTVTVTGPGITITANPTKVAAGTQSTLTVVATGATSVVITDDVDTNSYPLTPTGGTQVVTVATTTTYTATAVGASGTTKASVTVDVTPAVTITANPARITTTSSSTLTVTALAATSVVVTNNIDTTTYTLTPTGGTQVVKPAVTTIYTATATGTGGTATAAVTVTVVPGGTVNSVNHVLFLMQENRTFDTYFGMLNPYRVKNGYNIGDDGNTYNVDGIDDKLSTTNTNDEGTSFPLFHTVSSCLDDMTSAWLESYGDVSRYDFGPNRPILMDGFVHVAEGYAKSGAGDGTFTDTIGKRAMAYYEDTSTTNKPELNYYYYMASQFALSDRWFSPVSSKSTPNRIATMTGGTTVGLVRDPFVDDKLQTLGTKTIFEEMDKATPPASWKIYYTLTEGGCDETDGDCGNKSNPSLYPVTTFSSFGYSGKYLYSNPTHAACVAPTVSSKTAVGDASDAFCIDPTHIAPLSQLFTDFASPQNMASFSYIEPAYGVNDEHPGSGQSIFQGQIQVADILGKFMSSAAWNDSVFFLSYDEGGGPYDHVPPVPGHSNDKTNLASMGFLPGGVIPDISGIAVNADSFKPCLPPTPPGTPTANCDLKPSDPGANSTDAAAVSGFAAQLGFRLPNMVVSPFSKKHYVSHIPMDHTAVIKFVEDRFVGSKYLTARDAAQPNLLDFFDFTGIPWLTPPPATSIPTPPQVNGTCTPDTMQ